MDDPEYKIVIQEIGQHNGLSVGSTVVSIVLHSFLNFRIINERIEPFAQNAQKDEPPPLQVQFQAFNGQIYGMEVLEGGLSIKEQAPDKQQVSIAELAHSGALSYDPYK